MRLALTLQGTPQRLWKDQAHSFLTKINQTQARDERVSKLQADLDAKEVQVQTLQTRVWDLGQEVDNRCSCPAAAIALPDLPVCLASLK